MNRALPTALLTVLLCMFIFPVFGLDTTQIPDPLLQERYHKLTHELRCMQCQNQSIADSPVELAGELRREVRQMVAAGKTDQEVRDFMVARYGEFILFRPQFSVRNLWLWLGPGVLLLVGMVIGIRIVRQRSALVVQDDQPVDEEDLRP